MVRSVIWISSFALARRSPATWRKVKLIPAPRSDASAQTGGWKARGVIGNESPRAADYVVETPGDEEIDVDADPQADIQNGLPYRDLDDEPKTEIIKERFPNGEVKIERQVTQDAAGNYLNHGPWKMWDERGNLVAQGDYERGNRTGTWVRWYRAVGEADLMNKIPYRQFVGPFVSQATFKDGKLDGTWTIYDGKMRKISQWAFVDGHRHGPSMWWYANGHTMREAHFRDGDLDGELVEWSPEGGVRVNETHQAGRKLAAKTTYHADGKKKTEDIYLFAKDVEQTPDDWWNCKLQVTVKSGHDEKHGASAAWHPGGQRQFEGLFEHDAQVGQFTWWHANGQKALEGRYLLGKQDGVWTWWHANGQKAIYGQYANGAPTGRWTWWKEDGRVAQSADLSNAEGVVIDAPRTLVPEAAQRIARPPVRQPQR